MDFTKSIFQNRQSKGAPLLILHRGVCGANIPCNAPAAYKIAVDRGADLVEIDYLSPRTPRSSATRISRICTAEG